MTSIKSSPTTPETVELSPNYNLALAIIFLGTATVVIQPWLALVVSLFGLFLLFQTVSIRLRFTQTALEVYRSGNLLRRFPYTDWQNWQIFWQPVPILFYFKEVKSIHFLPILFNPKTLKDCLEKYCQTNSEVSSLKS